MGKLTDILVRTGLAKRVEVPQPDASGGWPPRTNPPPSPPRPDWPSVPDPPPPERPREQEEEQVNTPEVAHDTTYSITAGVDASGNVQVGEPVEVKEPTPEQLLTAVNMAVSKMEIEHRAMRVQEHRIRMALDEACAAMNAYCAALG